MQNMGGNEENSSTSSGSSPSPLHQQASLERLSPEILLSIVTYLPGFDTLWSLMRASPRTWQLFESHAPYITEGILSGPNSILPLSIRELVRAVILARTETPPFQSLDELSLIFLRLNMYSTKPSNTQLISRDPAILSVSTVPMAILRSVVATAYHLSVLSQACLASCLARLRDPGFQPMHAFDPEPHYTHDFSPVGEWVPAWDRVFVGRPVKIVDAGQPGWVEEMRALRAMWIIQLAGEMRYLVEERTGTLSWSEQDVKSLREMDDVIFADHVLGGSYNTEEVKTAMQYLTTLRNACKDIYYRLPRPPSAFASSRWVTALPKPIVPTLVCWGFHRNGRRHKLQEGSPIPADAKPIHRMEFNDAFYWGQTEDALGAKSRGSWLFRSVTMPDSPIEGAKFDLFRPLGFAFWDQQRMHLLGLADVIHSTCHNISFYIYAWESILPPEEVVRLKTALREAH